MYALNVLPLFLLFSCSLCSYAPYDLENADKYFADFIKKYDKKYESAEEFRKRFDIFKSTLEKINEWNANSNYENSGFKIHQFADEETHRSCLDLTKMNNTLPLTKVKKEFILNAPASLDYRDQNLVTPVKSQNTCGDCYVFAAIANIEGVHAKQNPGDLVSLSEQQVLDCLSKASCNPGYPIDPLNYAASQGCMTEENYPYENAKNTCRFDPNKVRVKVNAPQLFDTPDDETLKGILYQNGAPLVVSLQSTPSLQGYHGTEVFTPTDCTGGPANHAVLLVGYGTENGVAYWLFKNSWGTDMGDGGYYKLNMQNNCNFGREQTCSAT